MDNYSAEDIQKYLDMAYSIGKISASDNHELNVMALEISKKIPAELQSESFQENIKVLEKIVEQGKITEAFHKRIGGWKQRGHELCWNRNYAKENHGKVIAICDRGILGPCDNRTQLEEEIKKTWGEPVACCAYRIGVDNVRPDTITVL